MKNDLTLKIHSREGIIFDGKVSTLSSSNTKGKFDIFPLHSNFITLINDKVNYTDAVTKQSHEVAVNNAILKFTENQVDVYLGLS